MKRKKWIGLLAFLPCFLWIAACQPTEPLELPSTSPAYTITPTLIIFPATARPSPTATSFTAAPPTPSPLSPTLTPTLTQVVSLCSPLAWETIPELQEIVSDPYNPPPMGSDERHQGVDFSHYSRKGYQTIEGEPVQSVFSGVVVSAIKNRLPYGNMVIIETAYPELPTWLKDILQMTAEESLYLLYAHFGHEPLVNLGDSVQCGQVIGDVGSTGYNIVNPHLHLEARLGQPGMVFPSMAFYTTSATEQEMDNYRLWRMSGAFRHFDPMILFSVYQPR